jgi:hypothetical protein
VFARIILEPTSCRSRGSTPFTVPRVPTGINAGVSMEPCGVWKTPARASPSLEMRSKEKPVIGEDELEELRARAKLQLGGRVIVFEDLLTSPASRGELMRSILTQAYAVTTASTLNP